MGLATNMLSGIMNNPTSFLAVIIIGIVGLVLLMIFGLISLLVLLPLLIPGLLFILGIALLVGWLPMVKAPWNLIMGFGSIIISILVYVY
jgi:hypothetical protein